MRKSEKTKQKIIEAAIPLASEYGLKNLSIGQLAEATGMSKGGLFGPFGSKTNLQLEVVKACTTQFSEFVIEPILQYPVGREQIDALIERVLLWNQLDSWPNGCLIEQSTQDFDSTPGPVRDLLF